MSHVHDAASFPTLYRVIKKGKRAGHEQGEPSQSLTKQTEGAKVIERQQKIVRVSVEVRSGMARFRVGVQAESIRKALSMVGGRYSQGEVRVLFPIEPEGFFVREPTGLEGMGGSKQVYTEAA
jgi:hypothetical protein